jgi:hypothetical protein
MIKISDSNTSRYQVSKSQDVSLNVQGYQLPIMRDSIIEEDKPLQ